MSDLALAPDPVPAVPDSNAVAGTGRRRYRKPLIVAAALAASIGTGWIASGALKSAPDSTDGGVSRAGAVPRGIAHVAGVPRPAAATGRPAAAAPGSGTSSVRAAGAALARSLFAPHSWHIDPPPPPPARPLPPPPPTAPPFPYTFLGAYTQGGDTVYFLSREDRVIDAHVGDHLDGTYVLESADAARLVFNYTPLNIRQSVSAPNHE